MGITNKVKVMQINWQNKYKEDRIYNLHSRVILLRVTRIKIWRQRQRLNSIKWDKQQKNKKKLIKIPRKRDYKK